MLSSFVEFLLKLSQENPWHLLAESLCLFIIVFLLTRKTEKKEAPLTEAEIDEIVADWKPEPLVSQKLSPVQLESNVVITGPVSAHVVVNKEPHINFATNDFLSLTRHPDVVEKALQTIDTYGCGSCGPRAFYGSIDVHIHLEKKIAAFMGTPKSLIFASDVATPLSTIPTFSKSDDFIVCDEAIGFSLQEGCRLSKSQISTYKHNDMKDLEEKLIQITKGKGGKKAKLTRRFIVFEAISSSLGDIAPLTRLVELKHKYKFRLIMDESFSVGVLGATGRGLTEATKVDIKDIDIVTSSLSNALGSMGGFCCGSNQVVDHQKLTAAGYIFSASSPPYLSVAAMEALDVLSREPQRLTTLRNRCALTLSSIQEACKGYPYVTVTGAPESPIVAVTLPRSQPESDDYSFAIRNELLKRKIIVQCIQSAVNERRTSSGIKIKVTIDHTDADIKELAKGVSEALAVVLAKK